MGRRDVEWTYYRKEGDIVVHAETKEIAITSIRNHGFLIIDVEKIVQTDTLDPVSTDNIKREEIS